MYPDIGNLNLRPDGRNFKFDRSMRGYDPRQVDEKINELYAQIENLTSQNQRLNGAMGEFNNKIRLLTENANKLQQERIQENMRLASAMTEAVRISDESKAKAQAQMDQAAANARIEAQRIIDAARAEAQKVTGNAYSEASVIRSEAETAKRQIDADIAAVREILNNIERSFRDALDSGENYYANMSAVIRGAKTTLPEPTPEPADVTSPYQPQVYTPAPASTQTIPFTQDQAFKPLDAQTTAPKQPPVEDYDAMLKRLGVTPDDMIQRPKGNCLGHFGS